MKKYDFSRFKEAQNQVYTIAVMELRNGKKQSHWMQYIFPQIVGADYSELAKKYALQDLEEAKAFLNDETL